MTIAFGLLELDHSFHWVVYDFKVCNKQGSHFLHTCAFKGHCSKTTFDSASVSVPQGQKANAGKRHIVVTLSLSKISYRWFSGQGDWTSTTMFCGGAEGLTETRDLSAVTITGG